MKLIKLFKQRSKEEIMYKDREWKKYYGTWSKVYLMRFADKETGQFVALKPGHTKFTDAEDRMRWNHKEFLEGGEPDSFINHFDVDCIWSLTVESEWEKKYLEGFMLRFFGEQKKLNFRTSGYKEVRNYNQGLVDRWLSKKKEQYKKWLKLELKESTLR